MSKRNAKLAEKKSQPDKEFIEDAWQGFKQPVFKHCNVCGRTLALGSEFEAGMCVVCANEEMPE